jgi:hypothetical protein
LSNVTPAYSFPFFWKASIASSCRSSKPDDVDFHEETTDPLVADLRNFYKVEKWTRDGTKVDGLLYAGNSLGRARSMFEQAIKYRPRIRLTIR